MARKGRIEFAGAVYHVLDRGDRQEPIVRSEGDSSGTIVTGSGLWPPWDNAASALVGASMRSSTGNLAARLA